MDGKKDLLRTIGGIIFAVLLLPAAILILTGFAELLQLVFDKLPNLLAITFLVFVFFILIIITVASKTYPGGGSAGKLFGLKKSETEKVE